MSASAHAFVRGSTTQFYKWLNTVARPAIPNGPPVWICGDCHVGNLGPVASADGLVAIQVRDLDQTVVGNPAHDMIRLALSLAMAARGSDLPGVTTARMLERMVEGYQRAFRAAGPDGTPGSGCDMPQTVRRVMRSAAGRSWKHLADERIEGEAPFIPLGKRFWPLADPERAAIRTLFEGDDIRALLSALRDRKDGEPIRVLDATYWRKGCSSLGLFRAAVLVAIGAGKTEQHCLIDIKEATAAAAPAQANDTAPIDPAQRVVAGARALSPFLGHRMLATTLLGKPVFVRELLPQDLKLEIEHLSVQEAMQVAEYLAEIIGRAHARQMSEAERTSWLSELDGDRTRALDAPCWLWDSVVALVGIHEAAYLTYCRNWAMEHEA